jgi:hypothetical protein
MARRVRLGGLPDEPMVVRFEVSGHRPRFLLLKPPEISLCDHNLGFPERLVVRTTLGTLAAWWRGDVTFLEARRQGLSFEGPKGLIRAFPGWFDLYLFAGVRSANEAAAAAR